MADSLIPVISAGIGAIAALSGVLIKGIFDSRLEKKKLSREASKLFLEERKALYDDFLDQTKREVASLQFLRDILVAIRDGRAEPSVEEAEATAPPSVMKEIANTMDQIRRLAQSYAVVVSAESVVRLFIDMTRASRRMLDAVAGTGEERWVVSKEAKQEDDILWFLLCRLIEDRQSEFVFAYRMELGIGNPVGGPAQFPIQPRPWPAEYPEHVIRRHIIPRRPVRQR